MHSHAGYKVITLIYNQNIIRLGFYPILLRIYIFGMLVVFGSEFDPWALPSTSPNRSSFY